MNPVERTETSDFRSAEMEVEVFLESRLTSTIDRISKEIEENKRAEMVRMIKQPQTMFGTMSMVPASPVTDIMQTGEWNRKNTNDLIEMCHKDMTQNAEYGRVIGELKVAMINEFGEEEYERCSDELTKAAGENTVERIDPATAFFTGRFTQRFMELLKERQIPQSEFDYITKMLTRGAISIVPSKEIDRVTLRDATREYSQNASPLLKVFGGLSMAVPYIASLALSWKGTLALDAVSWGVNKADASITWVRKPDIISRLNERFQINGTKDSLIGIVNDNSSKINNLPDTDKTVDAQQSPEENMESVKSTKSTSERTVSNQEVEAFKYRNWLPFVNNAVDRGDLRDLGQSVIRNFGPHLGTTLAMLPDMLFGMLTGKGNLAFKDNWMPLSFLLLSLGVKNDPLLKTIMFAVGGGTLLSNVGKIIEGNAEAARYPQYKKLPDEPLNPRLHGNITVQGMNMIMMIDDFITCVTLTPETAEAYKQGAIPLNTLANSVLRQYCRQSSGEGNSAAAILPADYWAKDRQEQSEKVQQRIR